MDPNNPQQAPQDQAPDPGAGVPDPGAGVPDPGAGVPDAGVPPVSPEPTFGGSEAPEVPEAPQVPEAPAEEPPVAEGGDDNVVPPVGPPQAGQQ